MDQMRSSKSVLAKLLSSENLTVEHGNFNTAAFDVKNRVLYLPVFKYMNGDVYDLMVLHEVGHALYTPEDGYHSASHDLGQGFKSYLNVCEDARIEKKIKRKYPGGVRGMTQGYRKLMAEDFFGTARLDVDQLNLIDRINLHTKGGASQGIHFNEVEKGFLDRVESAETFEEVEQVARDIYAYSQENESQTDFHDSSMMDSYEEDENGESSRFDNSDNFDDSDEFGDRQSNNSQSNDRSDEQDEGMSNSGNQSEGDGKDDDEQIGSGPRGGFGGNRNPSSYTDEQWQDNAHRLNEDNTKPYVYVNIPKANLENIVVDYKMLYQKIDNYYTQSDSLARTWYNHKVEGSLKEATYQQAKRDVSEFRKKNNKIVDYLVKEFEMRKRADEYKRTSTSKTGLLDMSNIHSYKYSDNLFKRVATVTSGKNHGLVMFIDWSGSMAQNLGGTIDQLLNLVMFCRKVNIPFQVFAFSDTVTKARLENGEESSSHYGKTVSGLFTENEKDYVCNFTFSLLELFSNKMNAAELGKAFEFMMIMKENLSAYSYYYRCQDVNRFTPGIPDFMQLCGTPLNSAIIAALEVIPKFQKENRVQIVNSVFLTDGDSHYRQYYMGKNKHWEAFSVLGENVFFVDPVTKKDYRADSRYDFTELFYQILKDRLGVNIMGFYLINNGMFKRFSLSMASVMGIEQDEILKKFRTKNCFVATKFKGYDELYYLKDGKNLNVDSEGFTVKEDATKGQIASAFKKFNRDKLASRIIMKSFAEMIA